MGCAHQPSPLTINVPDSLRSPCERPAIEGVKTVGDLAAVSIRQEAALSVCDARKSAVIAIVDAYKAVVDPKPWWKWW
jgi:hypothetical protein